MWIAITDAVMESTEAEGAYLASWAYKNLLVNGMSRIVWMVKNRNTSVSKVEKEIWRSQNLKLELQPLCSKPRTLLVSRDLIKE